MAWAQKSGATRKFGWLVPTLLALINPSGFAQQNTSPARPTVQRQIVISVPDRKLAVIQDGAVLRVFSIAVGAADSPSPTGTFEVVKRLEQPTYYHPGQIIPPGENNPLGPRWIGLNVKGYGIHGTNVPSSVGKAASHGCIRLRNRDIVQLFAMVRIGDTVEIHGERDEAVAALFGGEPEVGADTQIRLARQQDAGDGVAGAQ
jgi:lipoprotein-anchoring transpeptidase ErfK/SrfK